MAYMLVRQSVQDYEAWKSVFDSGGDLRRRNGEKSYQILRQENDSNNLVALFDGTVWTTPANLLPHQN
jgi:hypothetical protein